MFGKGYAAISIAFLIAFLAFIQSFWTYQGAVFTGLLSLVFVSSHFQLKNSTKKKVISSCKNRSGTFEIDLESSKLTTMMDNGTASSVPLKEFIGLEILNAEWIVLKMGPCSFYPVKQSALSTEEKTALIAFFEKK